MKYLETDLNIEQSDQPILQIILNIGPWWFGDVWNPRSAIIVTERLRYQCDTAI